jgi:hypothetical protein
MEHPSRALVLLIDDVASARSVEAAWRAWASAEAECREAWRSCCEAPQRARRDAYSLYVAAADPEAAAAAQLGSSSCGVSAPGPGRLVP